HPTHHHPGRHLPRLSDPRTTGHHRPGPELTRQTRPRRTPARVGTRLSSLPSTISAGHDPNPTQSCAHQLRKPGDTQGRKPRIAADIHTGFLWRRDYRSSAQQLTLDWAAYHLPTDARAPDLVAILSNDQAVLNVEVVHHPHRNPGTNRQRVIRKTLAIDQLEGHLQIVEHPLRCGIPLDRLDLGLGTAFEDPGIVFQHLTLAVMNHPTRGHFPYDVIGVKLLKHVK